MIGAAGRDGFAACAVENDIFCVFLTCGSFANDVNDVFFVQTIELGAVSVERGERLFELAHLFFAADDLDDCVARHDSQLREERTQQFDVGVVHAVEEDGIGELDDKVLFYHSSFDGLRNGCGRGMPLKFFAKLV